MMRPNRLPRLIPLCTVAAFALALTGCSALGPQPLPPADRDVPVGAADRDPAAVRAALAALDPCALLDPAVSLSLGIAAAPDPGLHSCAIDGRVQASLYEAHPADARFWQERRAVGGAVGYVTSPLLDSCSVLLPVDFGHSIEFAQRDGGERDCTAVEAYAAAAAGRLAASPASLARADRDGVAACDLLAPIVGAPPAGAALEPRAAGLGASLAECGVWEAPSELGFVPVDPLQSLRLSYSVPLAALRLDGSGWADYEVRTIGAAEVMYWSEDPDDAAGDDGGCRLLWDGRPATRPGLEDRVVRAEVFAATCGEAARLVERVAPALRDAQPASALPASGASVVFDADEPDGPAVGACAHALGQAARECAPALPAEVPADPAAFVAQGEADPDVVCAGALDIAAGVLGAPFSAVTARARGAGPGAEPSPLVCELVEPSHALVVQVRASTGAFEAPEGAAAAPVAGHEAVLSELEREGWEARRSASIALAGPGEPGSLEVAILMRPSRTEGTWSGARTDEAPAARLEALAEALAGALLERS